MGRHTGTVTDGSLVNNIPGASYASVRSGLNADSPEPVFTLPRTGTLTITRDGSTLTSASQSEVQVTGAGFSIGVEGINLDPMQRDTLTFRSDAPDLAYRASGNETPRLVLAFQRPGADYLIEVRSSAVTAGQVLRLAVDPAASRARLRFDGSTSAPAFEFYMERVADDGTVTVFHHAGVASTASSVLSFAYADWTGDGAGLRMEVDSDGNGTVDRSEMLSDEP